MSNRNVKLFTVILLILILYSPGIVFPRPKETFTWPGLFADSDVVVIAEGESNKDTDKVVADLEGGIQVGVNTRFEIFKTIQGKLEGNELTLFHYRWLKQRDRKIDPPHLVDFKVRKPDSRVLAVEYLLFLKRLPDGHYEPTYGQTNPSASIRELADPTSPDQ